MTLVTPSSLTDFLRQLGRCFRQAGRLYLVGGSSLILVDAKNSTFDIDFSFDVDTQYHGDFIRCMRQVSKKLAMSAEQAAPHQFMPLPRGYEQRHRFIGRFTQLDVFHYDFYSVALSKIERGLEKDMVDVAAMVERQVIEFERLEGYYDEVLPQIDTFGLKSDSADFTRKFNLLKQRL